MIIWGFFIPAITLLFIFYFQYFDQLFRGKKEIYKIDPSQEINPLGFEYKYTLINLIIFLVVGLFTGYVIQQGWTKVDTSYAFQLSNVLHIVAGFFIALLLHDIYFYVTHRLLHTKFMFRRIHSWHHRSHHTNPWSAFSFHPLEGVLQIGIVPLVAFILPISEIALFAFAGFLLFMTVYGHSGYELRANKRGALHIFNTSLHHYQHHKFVRYNFGLYLNLWDRIFSTNSPGYKKKFEKLSARILNETKNSNHAE